MAHGFKDLGSKTTFATKKQLAWHKLGKVVDAMTSKEAIVLGGLDFEVGLAPLRALLSTDTIRIGMQDHVALNDMPKVPNNFATYRKDTNHVFGVVGSRYEVIQNIEAFEFFDSIIGEGHAKYETVGALGNGEKVFLTAKIPEKMLVGKEHIDKYLLFSMAHDGTGSIIIMFTPIRVVCNNTLSAATNFSTNKVSIRHTKNARNRIEDAKTVLGIVHRNGLRLEEVFNQMTKVKMHEQEIGELVIKSFGFVPDDKTNEFSTKTKNKFKDIMDFHESGVGQELIRGTAWGAYNAITGYQQNVQTYRNDNSEFDSIFNKGSANIRQKAFNELVTLL